MSENSKKPFKICLLLEEFSEFRILNGAQVNPQDQVVLQIDQGVQDLNITENDEKSRILQAEEVKSGKSENLIESAKSEISIKSGTQNSRQFESQSGSEASFLVPDLPRMENSRISQVEEVKSGKSDNSIESGKSDQSIESGTQNSRQIESQSGSEASFFIPDLPKIIPDDPLKLEIDRNIERFSVQSTNGDLHVWSNITEHILVTRPTGSEAKTLSKVNIFIMKILFILV
jgi:hypothetical protein